MGGTIWLESTPGSGSTFHFTVALDTVAAARRHVGRSDPGSRDMPVLIVDDNAVNRRILETQLTAWGMRPTTAGGGQEAIEILVAASGAGNAFPLVLLDSQHAGSGRLRRGERDCRSAGARRRDDHDAQFVGRQR